MMREDGEYRGRKFEDKINLRAIWQRTDNNVFVYGHFH